ncbi:hypothetical protein [Pseudomonas graminis]|uniref:Uncharacterized protein n=1 Tax=Pseudomonas graminis TaxID=158627 RepID=A0A1C2E0D1_9PSED|nr:hypothetical protein [Pseudomonas graminis]OCX20451.1 hypothetical protein BBI10_12890 [Pseudomonas graminis]
MSDARIQQENLSRFRKYLRIDAALFIASMVGAFTLSGFAYLEKFYLTLDVSVSRINITTQQFLAYGAAGFGSYLAAMVFAMALVGAVTLLIVLFEKPTVSTDRQPDPARWIVKARDRAARNRGAFIFVGCIGLIAFLLFAAWALLVTLPSGTGRTAALDEAATCTARRFDYANLNHFEGCQVAESDDMVFILQRTKCDEEGVEFRTLELPKQGLKSISSPARKYLRKQPDPSRCGQ